MQILGVPLRQITVAFLEQLRRDQTPESLTHDYKAKLPDRRDEKSKARFLKSATAFANTAGGIFVFGLDAETGADWTLDGLASFDEDGDVVSLSNLLRSGVEPALPHVEPAIRRRAEGQPILLLGVPRSLAAPHRVSPNYDGGFWRRGLRENQLMSVAEIRTSFNESGRWRESAERFRRQRIADVISGEVAFSLNASRGGIFLHLLPLGRIDDQIDLPRLMARWKHFEGSWGDELELATRPNVEGWLCLRKGHSDTNRYLQVFRSGGVESYWSFENFTTTPSGLLEGNWVEQKIAARINQALATAEALGVTAPYAIYITILGGQSRKIVDGRNRWLGNASGFHGQRLFLPSVVLEGLPADLSRAVQPALDLLWQAAGWERSPYFDANGAWASEGKLDEWSTIP